MKEDILETAAQALRDEHPEPAEMAAALERVAARISSPSSTPILAVETEPAVLRTCADVQALIPAHLSGRLSAARALLLEDHARSCVPCRRAIKSARAGVPVDVLAWSPAGSARRRPATALLALAASVLLAAGIGAAWLARTAGGPAGNVAHVETVDGLLLAPDSGRALTSGAALGAGQAVRTARGSTTLLKLVDGSRVELAERSEASVTVRRDGTTVHLERGRLIVQAAKQRGGHLWVKTPDCLVAVTGTVFSVSQGTKGTRVSVLEGEVHVDDGRGEKVLHRGEQVATHASVEPVSLASEFAWSRDRAAFAELLGEVARVQAEVAAIPASWAHRTSTRLLDAAPPGTVVYAAAPNVSATVADFFDRLDERIGANPALAAWWAQGPGGPERSVEMKRALEVLRTWGSYLGEEIVLTVATDPSGSLADPLLTTTVTRPGFREFLQTELARLGGSGGLAVHVVDDPASAAQAPGGKTLFVWLNADLLAASFDPASLVALQTSLASPDNPFRAGSFHARLADAYRDGIDWLLGVDAKPLLVRARERASSSPGLDEVWSRSGLGDVEHLLIERRSDGALASAQATLTFDRPRRGLAAWLAAPGPIGALGFVSPDATAAVGFVVKEPALLVDDLFAVFEAGHPDFQARLAQFEAEQGFRVKEDLAAPLGGEVAFALDGPLLPTPAWKLVVEVYDPPRLQATLEKLVARLDAALRKEGKGTAEISTREAGGRTVYALVLGTGSTPLQYTFVDGYLVMAPERALLDRALSVRESGYTLTRAPKFTALLPKDGRLDFSVLAYQDLGAAFSSIAQGLGIGSGTAAQTLAAQGAALGYGYAEPSRIVFASSGASILGLDISSLAWAGLAAPVHGSRGTVPSGVR